MAAHRCSGVVGGHAAWAKSTDDPVWPLSTLRGCLDHPAGLRVAELRDEVVARLLDRLARAVEGRLQPEIVLEDLAVDDDRPDVRDVGGADNGANGIDDR